MKVLKITGDYEQRKFGVNDAFEGYATYDEESKMLLGYLCRNVESSTLMTTSYIIGSYDPDNHELEFLEVQTTDNKEEDDTLFIFEDIREEGIWGQCDLKYEYFNVGGNARIKLEETEEQRVKDIDRAVEYLEAGLDEIDAYRVITDYQSTIHYLFPGIFRDYFNS